MPYQDYYRQFMAEYVSGVTDGLKVGEAIVQLAHFFSDANIAFASAEGKFRTRAAEIEQTIDENTGKPISSAKAKVLSDATSESQAYVLAQVHVQNIEVCINALKNLQKGVMNEYSHMGNT